VQRTGDLGLHRLGAEEEVGDRNGDDDQRPQRENRVIGKRCSEARILVLRPSAHSLLQRAPPREHGSRSLQKPVLENNGRQRASSRRRKTTAAKQPRRVVALSEVRGLSHGAFCEYFASLDAAPLRNRGHALESNTYRPDCASQGGDAMARSTMDFAQHNTERVQATNWIRAIA